MKQLFYSDKEKTTIKKFYNDIPRHVTIYLEKEGQPTGIHCIYCKKKLFEIQQSVSQIVPGAPIEEVKHLAIKCQNPGCKTTYYFVGLV